MIRKLKPGERCPIHRRRDCCGRAEVHVYERKKHTKWEQVRPGVRRIGDEHADHPDGYRYKYSPAEMKKVVDKRIREQHGICAECHEPFTDYREVGPDHIKPKGMGGARADDRPENIRAVHHTCNSEKGSRRISVDEAGQDEAQSHTAEITGRGQASGHSEGRRDPSLAGVEHSVEERNAAEE